MLVVEDDVDLALLVGRVIESVAPELHVDVASTASRARAKLTAFMLDVLGSAGGSVGVARHAIS